MKLIPDSELHCTNVNENREQDSSAFSNRMKALVDQLSIAETLYNRRIEDVGSDYMVANIESTDICRSQHVEGSRKRKYETHKFRGRQSIFKQPERPAPRTAFRSIPDYHRNPHKWTKYSLDDVSNEDMTDRSNTRAALSFLKELKARKKQEKTHLANRMDIDESDMKSPIKSRQVESTSMLEFKKPKSETMKPGTSAVVVCTDDKPVFRNSKIIMPEYVVGQKQTKKTRKNKIPQSSCSLSKIKLDHLEELD